MGQASKKQVNAILRRTAERAESANARKSRKLWEQIERIKGELERVQPRSRRQVELETRLRDLMLQILKQEVRAA